MKTSTAAQVMWVALLLGGAWLLEQWRSTSNQRNRPHSVETWENEGGALAPGPGGANAASQVAR